MRLFLIRLLCKGLKMTDSEVIEFRDSGWTLATNEQVAHDAQMVANRNYMDGRLEGLNSGKDIGRWEVLRYTRDNPKWQDIADKFDFDKLEAKFSQERLP